MEINPQERLRFFARNRQQRADESAQYVSNTDHTEQLRRGIHNERRRRPDRRRRQEPIEGVDRRRIRDRRQPLLLDPRTRGPKALVSRKGQMIDAQV